MEKKINIHSESDIKITQGPHSHPTKIHKDSLKMISVNDFDKESDCKFCFKSLAHNVGKSQKKITTSHMLPTILHKGSLSINSDNFVYSWTKLHLLSFLTGSKVIAQDKTGKFLFPSPTFIDCQEWQIKPDLSKNVVIEGMVIEDKKGLVLVDKKIMAKFKGIISDMLGQLVKSFFGGGPVSLKVNLFEPKSTLQRIADYWSFAIQYLTKAALADSALERVKYVLAFIASGFYISTKQLKPFNPLIGETFQGEFENGAKVYVEHISHYPNYARFLIIDENFKLHGYYEFKASPNMWGSQITVHQTGPTTIEFPKTRDKLVYNMPEVLLLNASSEKDRIAQWVGTTVVSDEKNGLQAFMKFAHNSKYVHGFDGVIYSHQFPKTPYKHFDHVKRCNGYDISKVDKYVNKNLQLGKISGSWLKDLKIDEEVLWDINVHIPDWIRPLTNVLPSDGRFREDLIWLYRSFTANNEAERLKYQEYAQGWKVAIEIVQRKEREIKKKNKKK
jgi:hypothetical protein